MTRLRAEAAECGDPTRKARLLYELGEIEERASDETSAARDYLAAYNADTRFREPIEALLRLLERRRSLRNLGKVVEAVVRAADTGDEEVRALTVRAFFLDDVGGDIQAAKDVVVEATAVEGAAAAEASMAWLTLEMISARMSDAPARARALAMRADMTRDPTWRGLLLLDAARAHVAAGDHDTALDLVGRARAVGGGATFAAAIAGERLARVAVDESKGDPSSDEAARRVTNLAEAIEAQGALIETALKDATAGDTAGVPLWSRTPARMVDAWLRAAEMRAVAGENTLARGLLDRAALALKSLEGADPSLWLALIDAQMRTAEQSGDTALAAQLAEQRLAVGGDEDGSVVAALTMRIAEHAASEGDVPRALLALADAVAKDPVCVPARALQLDLLADDEPTAFAAQLEALADDLPTDEGRARAFLLASWIWGARAGDGAAAKAALAQSSFAGTPAESVARIARTLASLTRDPVWYEEATRRLLAEGATDEERAMLWLELARARFGRGDSEGGAEALREISESPRGAWIGRALEAFMPGAESEPRGREALDELAGKPQPDDVARGLLLMAAMRAHRAGDVQGARTRLRDLVTKQPDDVLTAAWLLEVERSRGALDEVARVAEAAARASTDEELAPALRIEAALARWRHRDREGAIASLEEAVELAPEAARAVLAWAARGIEPDHLQARRRAIARELDAGGDEASLLLERFAVNVASGDVKEGLEAIDTASSSTDPALALAGSLARVAFRPAGDDADAMMAALSRIASAGEDAAALAAGEDYRRAAAGDDPERALDSARMWFHAGGGLAAAMEWLGAAMVLSSANGPTSSGEEKSARRAIAATVPGDLRESLLAGVALLHAAATPDERSPLLVGASEAVRLVNLELAPPGSDPRRRIVALRDLDGALGPDAEADASSLSGWSWLVEGNAAEAILAFERATAAHPEDIGAWEGLRTAAEMMQDEAKRARACEELGARCKDDLRGASFWEQAGLALSDLGRIDEAEAAFFHAFARDATRSLAFDRLFRRVRERKEGDLLLELIGRRLAVCDDPIEIAKLFWEQARVLREKGDPEAALKALENVTMLEPDHVGALALTGEIAIRRGKFEEAAEALSRLALLDGAPAKNRVTAGVAAVDIFEKKLNRFDRALEILSALHKAKLSSLPVRERLARAAARTGSWKDATAILEELMHERPEPDGRIEAARLAMAIHRDRLDDPNGAGAAVVKLLEESPVDGEAIDMLLAIDVSAADRTRLLTAARKVLVESLQRRADLPSVKRLAKTARALGDEALQQIALSVAIVVGGHDPGLEQQFAQVAAKKPRAPQIALSESILKQVMDPGDRGPAARLFIALAPTIAEALGPSLAGCGVTRKDKVDPRSGIALRNEIAAWAGAFGITEFDLYVGGKDPLDVQGVPGEVPALVVGAGVNAPLAPATRARVARELLAMVRGSTIARHRDDTTIAAIMVAACNLAEVKVDAPSYAVLADVERQMSKAISRKTKKGLPELCQAVVASNTDVRAWSKRALASHARIATLASGDVAVALMDALAEPLERLPVAAKSDPRAEDLIRFALSPAYLDLRRALGLEGGAT